MIKKVTSQTWCHHCMVITHPQHIAFIVIKKGIALTDAVVKLSAITLLQYNHFCIKKWPLLWHLYTLTIYSNSSYNDISLMTILLLWSRLVFKLVTFWILQYLNITILILQSPEYSNKQNLLYMYIIIIIIYNHLSLMFSAKPWPFNRWPWHDNCSTWQIIVPSWWILTKCYIHEVFNKKNVMKYFAGTKIINKEGILIILICLMWYGKNLNTLGLN
jgi:hypothetical protein